MSKYIDADKLKAEIEMRISQWQSYTFACASQIASEAFDRIDELKGLLIYITSLQQEQPEADLDREIIKYKVPFTDESEYLNETTLDAIAYHFYELGLNARNK